MNFSRRVYEGVKSQVEKSLDLNPIRNENTQEKNSPFAAMIQIYSHETATSLKAKTTVVYPVHNVLLKFTKDFRRPLINHGHATADLLPVSVSECTGET